MEIKDGCMLVNSLVFKSEGTVTLWGQGLVFPLRSCILGLRGLSMLVCILLYKGKSVNKNVK